MIQLSLSGAHKLESLTLTLLRTSDSENKFDCGVQDKFFCLITFRQHPRSGKQSNKEDILRPKNVSK